MTSEGEVYDLLTNAGFTPTGESWAGAQEWIHSDRQIPLTLPLPEGGRFPLFVKRELERIIASLDV